MGNASAGVDIGAAPPACVTHIGHAKVGLNDDLAVSLKLERAQGDYGDHQRDRCGADWQTIREGVFNITSGGKALPK